MRDIFLDKHPWQMWILARQWGKTTSVASILGHGASTNRSYDQTYINFEQEALKTFSENKFRKELFATHPLSEYIQGLTKWGSANKVQLKTGSTIDLITSLRNWAHGQGKSNKRIVIDEGQDHDWTGYHNFTETQTDTMGDTIIAGIGGFQDTQYHNLWRSTNQMEYEFDHSEEYKGYPKMSWRRELERNCFDENGLIYGPEMLEALAGKWDPKEPRNYARHGYHLSQLQNPRIPLTKKDAVELYKVPEHFSIEAKKEDPDYTQDEFIRYVLAQFSVGETKPITEEMMYKLVDKTIGFTPSSEVDHSLGPIFVGVDWGGGGRTVVWVWQLVDENKPIFRLLFAVRLTNKTADEQYETVRNIIEAYDAEQAIVDAGGGTHQVEQLQKHFGSRCLRNIYAQRPGRPIFNSKAERKKLRRDNMFMIDKTYSLDAIVDLIRIKAENSPRIILPGENFQEIEWIIKQFVNEEIELVKNAAGQQFRRYFTSDGSLRPDDALHACNYAYLAWLHTRISGGHFGGPVGLDPDPDDIVDDLL